MQRKFIWSSFVLLIFALQIVSASVILGSSNASYYLDSSYGADDKYRGWINVSIKDESGDSVLYNNRNQSIVLKKFLDANGVSYSCSPNDCGNRFQDIGGAQTTRVVSLGSSESKTIGIKYSGVIQDITKLEFDFQSSAPTSCSSQITLDFLNDGVVDIVNTKISDEVCGTPSYGCFSSAAATELYTLKDQPYCQKISLNSAPGLKVGAWIKKVGVATPLTVTIQLKDATAGTLSGALCTVNDAQITSGGNEVFCDIEYSVPSAGEYYVCVFANDSNSGYQVRGNSAPSNPCGYYGNILNPTLTASYQISAQAKKFAPLSQVHVNETSSPELVGRIEQYLSQKYSGNCSGSDGCIVPFSLSSSVSQTATFSNLQQIYDTSSGGGISGTSFYDVQLVSPKLSTANFVKLDLGKTNFSVPNSQGNYSLTFIIANQTLFSQSITVQPAPKIVGILPESTAAGLPTTFVAFVQRQTNTTITEYSWDFGDGKKEKSIGYQISHTYNSTGTYTITLLVTDSKQASSQRAFPLIVGSARNVTSELLNKENAKLVKLKSQMVALPSWQQATFNEALALEEKEANLKKLQQKYVVSSTEQEFSAIINELTTSVAFPTSVNVSASGKDLLFFPKREVIDLAIVQDLGGGSYDDGSEQATIDALFGWSYAHVNPRMSYTTYSGYYSGEALPLFTVVDLQFISKEDFSNELHVVFKDLENLKFASDYGERVKEYTAITFDDSSMLGSVSFITTSDVGFDSLPVFFFPPLSNVVVGSSGEPTEGASCNDNNQCDAGESWKTCRSDCKPWGWLIFFLILLIIIAIVTYVLLYRWYSTNYERHLFTGNALYNLEIYIHKEKQKGLSNEQIKANLHRAGWNNEQIEYGFRKYEGKETGLVKIFTFKKKTTTTTQTSPQSSKFSINTNKKV